MGTEEVGVVQAERGLQLLFSHSQYFLHIIVAFKNDVLNKETAFFNSLEFLNSCSSNIA